LRVSSNVGIFRTGDTGTVGLRMDFRGKTAADYVIMSAISRSEMKCTMSEPITLRRFPFES
jgi:hypothetical protein